MLSLHSNTVNSICYASLQYIAELNNLFSDVWWIQNICNREEAMIKRVWPFKFKWMDVNVCCKYHQKLFVFITKPSQRNFLHLQCFYQQIDKNRIINMAHSVQGKVVFFKWLLSPHSLQELTDITIRKTEK